MFLLLTKEDDSKIRIRFDAIEYYKLDESGLTYIETATSTVIVKESPETLDQMLTESYIYVKSGS